MGVTTSHEYTACDDEDCQRYPCRLYKEGYADGYADGYQIGYAEGYAQGYSAGYQAGFNAGLASCPGPHGG